MKAILTTFLTICSLIIAGCATPVAIDPATGEEQTANYTSGNFYAPLDVPIKDIFRVAIAELDDMGYFRTGETHRENEITIFARAVGDDKVTGRASINEDPEVSAQSIVRIRVGLLGNLPESQKIFSQIRAAL